MKSRGIKENRIKQLLEEGLKAWSNEEDCWSDVDSLPHQDENTWRLLDCSRVHAERLLKDHPNGTFLVRPSRTGLFALSIMCNDVVNHCIIYATERGYGFAEPYNIYESLKALVLHYAHNSLEEHNDSLKTTLKYPIFSKSHVIYGEIVYKL